MSYSQRWKVNPNLPHRGDRKMLRGDPNSPVMTVVRQTQFDNGEVECLWFTADQRVQRAWLPADLLAPPPRQPFFKGSRK